MYSILHVYSFVIRTSDVGGGREYSSLYTEEGGGLILFWQVNLPSLFYIDLKKNLISH